MESVLKKTIWEEIEKFNKEKGEGSKPEGILPVNTIPANPKQKIKSNVPQTKRRLSNLLKKFRSKSCIRDSVRSSSEKMKKLQIKHECFDPISKVYKLARQKDGERPRFIAVNTEDTIVLKDIRPKVEKIFLITRIVIILSKSYMNVFLQ